MMHGHGVWQSAKVWVWGLGECMHGVWSYIHDALRRGCGIQEGFRMQGLVTYIHSCVCAVCVCAVCVCAV